MEPASVSLEGTARAADFETSRLCREPTGKLHQSASPICLQHSAMTKAGLVIFGVFD